MKQLKYMILAVLIITASNLIASQEAKIGEKAPDFTLSDSKGNTHKLSDFAGKYVVLEWINFDCPFVVKHYKSENMQQLQKKYTNKGVVWLSINSSAKGKQGNFDNAEINKRIKDLNANMTAYLIDEEGNVGKMYSAKVTPHMFIIDKKGILIYQGGIDDIKSTEIEDIAKAKNYIKTALDEVLQGKEISEKTTPPYGCSVKYK